MKKTRFILLNILATVIEISIIAWLLIGSLKDNLVLGIVSLSLYTIFLLVMTIVSFNKKSIFETLEFPEQIKLKVDEIYGRFRQHHKDVFVKFHYVEDAFFIVPAAYHDGNIYINSKYKFDPVFFEGIIAHELGHAKSGLVTIKWIHLLRITSIFARQIYTFRFKKRKWFKYPLMKIFDYILLVIYHLLSVLDHLVSNPFYREDEIYANQIAVEIGYGDSLRYFYYNSMISTSEDIKYFSKHYDCKHPSSMEMLKRLESDMSLDESEKDVFAVNDVIYKVINTNNINERYEKIVNWYLYKAKEDKPVILYELGMIYLLGKYKMKIDEEKALKYLNQAKDKGYLPAHYQVALYNYEHMSIDETMIYEDFKYLKDQELSSAYVYYAFCNAYGIGVQENQEEARKWFEKAAKLNNRQALNYLDVIGQVFEYEYHSNNLVDVEQDSYYFESINRVIHTVGSKESKTYQMKLIGSNILLMDGDDTIATFIVSKDRIVRKNVVIKKDEDKTYKTLITYKRSTSNG